MFSVLHPVLSTSASRGGSSTRACPNGRAATVTVRYNPERPGNGTVLLPSRCPDGTCDGCVFHFLWETALAGPACLESDYV